MNRLLASGLAIAAIALSALMPASAASLSIDDASIDGSITFNIGQFDAGIGFVIDGTQIVEPSVGNTSAAVSEGTAGDPITHTFSGQFITGGPLTLTSATIAFTEPGGGISDILTYAYTGGGFGEVATLTGTFVSDVESGGSLVAPEGAILVSEGTPFDFSNTNISASAVSDVEAVPVPEPASFMLLRAGLLGFGFLRHSRKMG